MTDTNSLTTNLAAIFAATAVARTTSTGKPVAGLTEDGRVAVHVPDALTATGARMAQAADPRLARGAFNTMVAMAEELLGDETAAKVRAFAEDQAGLVRVTQSKLLAYDGTVNLAALDKRKADAYERARVAGKSADESLAAAEKAAASALMSAAKAEAMAQRIRAEVATIAVGSLSREQIRAARKAEHQARKAGDQDAINAANQARMLAADAAAQAEALAATTEASATVA